MDVSFNGALVFTGGGTGGHYFPAVALAEGARERWPDLPIAFVGACRGIEAQKLPTSGWPHALFDVEGFIGRSPLALARALWKLWSARRALMRHWRRERPVAVIGTGGYGAAPALLAARSMGIPYFLHESNAAPGALVKQVSKEARRVWCGMAEAAQVLPGADCLPVGTPVRKAFLRDFAPLSEAGEPRQLLILGGSGGARPLNEALLALAPALLDRFPGWEILHQTGVNDHARLVSRPRHERHALVPFLENMDAVFERVALVVSRSGASTCAELMACGRPAVLVPFPQAAGDHQTVNAQAMVAQGRAMMVTQGDDLADRLLQVLSGLMSDSAACQTLSKPEPNQAVARCLDDLAALLEATSTSRRRG